MYYVYLGGELVFDALADSSPVVSSTVSQALNAAAYLDMTLAPPARPEEGQAAEVRWDSATLFRGRVTEVTQGADGTWDVSCVSDVDRLNSVLVPPHSTGGAVGDKCPASPSGYVQWLAETFNRRCVGGYRVDVGTNLADQLTEGDLSFEDESWPTVAAALEDRVLSLGGYLDWEPHASSGTLSVYADLHEASDQIVDLGENVADIRVTRTLEGRATAIVPHSGSGDGEVTLDGLAESERALVTNSGMCLSPGGDAIYDPASVAEWGYREERVELSGVSDRSDLVRAAIARLRTMAGPMLTVECRAVDMALYRDDMAHLRVGQAVRVRAEPLGVDEYLAVQSMDLDLMDPAQTTYVLGVTYDTLTGQQSTFLRGLNGQINHALDAVTGVEDTIGHVVNDADTDYYLSDSPDEPVGGEWGVANITAVDNKYVFSRPHNTLVDGTVVVGEPTLVTPAIRRSLKLHRDVGDDPVWVAFVAADSDASDDSAQGLCRISGQMGGWDASEQGAVTVCFGLQDSAYAGDGLAGVGIVTEKSSDIDTSKVTIQAYESQGRIGVYVMLTGKVTVSLYADGEGFSTPFVELSSRPSGTKVFDLADVQTTYESAILQADNALRAYVEATYATQAGVGESIAQLDLRADQIQASVEKKMDTAVANTTFVSKSTFDQTVGSITTTVEETKTVAEGAASDAQGAASDASSALTKASQVELTVEGLSTTVSETVETAEGAMTKASQVEQTVDGLEVTLDQSRYWGPWVQCGTAAATSAKVVTTGDGFRLVAGATISVRFTNGHTASTMTLNVNGTGAKAVYASGNNPPSLRANSTLTMFYSGASWTVADAGSLYNAKESAKTASNYLKFDSSGLCVGNQTASTLGYNTLIKSTGVDIRNGTTVLSSFGSSTVELGKNSSSAQIKMCGGRGVISYDSSDGLSIEPSGDDMVIGPASIKSIVISGSATSLGSSNAGSDTSVYGATISVGTASTTSLTLGRNGTGIRGIYVGTRVITGVTSTQKLSTVLTQSQFASIVGRGYKAGDVVLVSNGDYDAWQGELYAASYRASTNSWVVRYSSGSTSDRRFNYLIVAVA